MMLAHKSTAVGRGTLRLFSANFGSAFSKDMGMLNRIHFRNVNTILVFNGEKNKVPV